MKTLISTSVLAILFLGFSQSAAQEWPDERLGLPGDNLNLYAVMNLFQESETLESFERSLNDPDLLINNLDLNNDNYVDYIMVFDYAEDNIHNIVLRVALNQYEQQDVAVFIVEKLHNGSVRIQLIGDEALYGPNYIIEPNYAETPNPGYQGTAHYPSKPQNDINVVTTSYYEVASWPMIIYISGPNYVVWHSPWYWGYYPHYWHPWTAHYWHFYYGYHYHWHYHYYAYYRPWRYYRCGCYNTVYYSSIRTFSPTVVVNVRKGTYETTYQKPERVRDGKALFAQRHPDKVNKTLEKGVNNSPNESVGTKPMRQQDSRTGTPSSLTRPIRDYRNSQSVNGKRDDGRNIRNAVIPSSDDLFREKVIKPQREVKQPSRRNVSTKENAPTVSPRAVSPKKEKPRSSAVKPQPKNSKSNKSGVKSKPSQKSRDNKIRSSGSGRNDSGKSKESKGSNKNRPSRR